MTVCLLKLVCEFTPTLPDHDFLHLVGTVDDKPAHHNIHISNQSRFQSFNNVVVTVTVQSVEAPSDVKFSILISNSRDVGYLVFMNFLESILDGIIASVSHLTAERTPHPVRV